MRFFQPCTPAWPVLVRGWSAVAHLFAAPGKMVGSALTGSTACSRVSTPSAVTPMMPMMPLIPLCRLASSWLGVRQNVKGMRAMSDTSGVSRVSPAPTDTLIVRLSLMRYEKPSSSVPSCVRTEPGTGRPPW